MSGALSKPGKSGQHSCEKMLLLSKITTDQQTFIAQKNEPNGAKTMKQWYWRVCGAEWDQQHA